MRLTADHIPGVHIVPWRVAGVPVGLSQGLVDGRRLAGPGRVVNQLVLVLLQRQMTIGQQHNHLVFQSRHASHRQEVDANELGRAIAGRQAGVVGLSQVLQVMQCHTCKAPAPVRVATAKGQGSQPRVLLHPPKREGFFDEGCSQVNRLVFMEEPHVKGRLGRVIECRVAKGQGTKSINLAPVRGTVLPQVDVEAVVRLVGGRGHNIQRRHRRANG